MWRSDCPTTFLAVSLLCSATREAIASLFQTRAKVLLDGVLTLLHEQGGKPRLRGIVPSIKRFLRRDDGFGLARLGAHSLSAAVMTHPLITGLAQQGRMPSYIPSSIFARAFVATLTAKYGKVQTAAMLLSNVGNEGLSRTLLAIMGEGPDDLAALENAVRIWYETVMERITGWYKRRSQLVLFCVGLFYACAMNIDARWKLSQRLWRDDGASAKLAQQGADSIAAGRVTPPAAPPAGTPPADPLAKAMEVKKDVQAVQALPIGWPSPALRRRQWKKRGRLPGGAGVRADGLDRHRVRLVAGRAVLVRRHRLAAGAARQPAPSRPPRPRRSWWKPSSCPPL